MELQQDQTTREIAIRYPGTVPVFETLGIDYCCGGARTLGEACAKAHVDWDHLVQSLQAVDAPAEPVRTDWNLQPLNELTKYIVEVHHAYVRRSTPQIRNWIEKVVAKHGNAHPELHEISRLFLVLSEELSAHMAKEECILFPRLDQIATTTTGRADAGSIEPPIRQMIAEHDGAGEVTAKIHALTNAYNPPAEACPTYRALYRGLEEFERDLHQHVHLENNILFPRALQIANRG